MTKEYCVYEHYLGDVCIYVGSGDKYRPFEYYRNQRWTEFFPVKEDWAKVRKNVVHIYCITDNRKEAYKIEKELTLKRQKEGHPLTNIAIGSALYGENNGFYGRKHSKESIEKMREKHLINNKGVNNPMYGKRSANALYVTLYFKENKVKDFDTLKECREWIKENIESFPLKALKKMSKTGEEYEAFHKKYKKFNGYRIEKRKEKENN